MDLEASCRVWDALEAVFRAKFGMSGSAFRERCFIGAGGDCVVTKRGEGCDMLGLYPYDEAVAWDQALIES